MSFDLEEALRRFPLPEGVADAEVNRGQCATALGVSENIVTKYLDQGMPVLERGSNGQAYRFQLSECFAWKMWRDEEQRRRRDEGDRAAQQLALLFRNEDDDDPDAAGTMSPEEIAKQSEAIYRYDKAREQRNNLVRRERVEALFEEVLTEVRTQITTLVDYCEMEFGLSSDQVDKLQRRTDGALTQARHALSRHCPPELRPGETIALRDGMGDEDRLAL